MFILVVLIFYNGCMNLKIEADVDYPADLFAEAKKKIDRIHATAPDKRGVPSQLNVLVYDGEDRQLVSFSVPQPLVQQALEKSDIGKNEQLQEYSKKIGHINWEKMKNLDRLGPGLILEVEVSEGKGKVHVLIWLD